MAIKIAIWVTIMNEYRINLSRYRGSSYIHLLVIKIQIMPKTQNQPRTGSAKRESD